jgi:para-nitrobenzyl esterase
VTIHDGALQGAVADGVASFKGIPFAAPPVGDLRWRSPQPPSPWTGVKTASDYGPACMQMIGSALLGGRGPQSEDCLTVNVFTPANHTGAKLPVMVWIYGGAFIGGSAGRYDGTHFAQDGVVLVTFNYRLGRLGFFAHPALTRTNPEGGLADYGFADQIAALKWVKANIAAFGGDPHNVTVFGESAGGISVNFLMVSPKARGLFEKAASESGFGRTNARTLPEAEALGDEFIKGLGVTGDDAATAKAMRALSADALSAPVAGLGAHGIPSPVIDDVVVSETPGAGFAKGDQARVPYLVGGNSFEASLFRDSYTHPETVLDRLGPAKDAAVALYGGGDPAKAAAALTTMTFVIEPDRYLARQEAKVGVPAYVYYFSYVPAAQRATSMGVMHGGEIGYVFETLPKTPIDRGPFHIAAATPDDEAFAKAVHAYWVAFAKTGDPGSAGGVSWPMAAPNDSVLEFGSDGITARPDFAKVKLDPIARRADAAAP